MIAPNERIEWLSIDHLYKPIERRKLFWARLFGKRIVSTDGPVTVTAYRWRGDTFITHMQTEEA